MISVNMLPRAAFCVLLLSGLLYHVIALRKSSEIPPPFLANKQCRLLINEINIHPMGSGQFIELVRACWPEPKNVFNVNMEKFKLIFMDHSGFLVGVCDLKNEAHRRVGKLVYYVVGGSSVATKDMGLDECDFAEDAQDFYTKTTIPSGFKAPNAVALVYHPKGALKWISLKTERGRKYKVPITNDLEERLIPVVVDMYIYTTSSPYTSCDYFGTYYDGYKKDRQMILRDWSSIEMGVSLSRCNPEDVNENNWNPMQPDVFKYAKASPGDTGDCKTAVAFRVEDTQPIRDPPLGNYRTTPEYTCYITTVDPVIEAAGMITNYFTYISALKQLLKEAEMAAPEPAVIAVPGSVATDQPIKPHPMDPAKFECEIVKSVPHFWSDCSAFPHKDFINRMRHDKNSYVIPEHVLRTDVCNWMEYIVPDSFRCRLCNSLWNQEIIFDRPGSRNLKAVKNPRNFRTGTSISTKYKNKYLFDAHIRGPMHQLSTDYYKLLDEGNRGSDLHEEFYREGGPMRKYLEATEHEFFIVFQSTRMDIPFYKHPIMVQTITYFGINVGHLYLTPSGRKLITMSISLTMHEDFVADLLSRKPYMSLLVDSATDISTISSVAVMIMTYDSTGRVVIKVYRIIKATKRETGENLFKLMTDAFQEDGLTEYVKEKCIGFATDGGSNMVVLKQKLQEWTGTNMLTVHCYAHRLDLILDHSWETVDFLDDIDQMGNALHRILNSNSHKRKAILHEIAQAEGVKPFEIKRIIPTRWISSKRRALATIVTHWKIIIKALQALSADRTFKKKQRDETKTLETLLRDPTLIATMAFVLDAYEVLSAASLEFQKRGTTLIGKRAVREVLKAKLAAFKTEDGPFLKNILNNAVLSAHNNRKPANVQEFETEDIQLFGIQLETYDPDENNLYKQRAAYIDSVIKEVDWYFPADGTDNLDIFDPHQWDTTSLEDYGNTQLLELNRFMKWNYPPPAILQDWINLKASVSSRLDFGHWKTKAPEEFWLHYLAEGSGVNWPDSIKVVITNLLVVPASTAEVERIFSMFKNIKTPQRYSLDVSSVEALIRVKFNGPKDPADFNAPHYVRRFILQGHSRADDETRGGRKRTRLEDSDEDTLNDEDLGPGVTAAASAHLIDSDEDDVLEAVDDVETEMQRNFREIVYQGDEMMLSSTEADDEEDSDY